MFRNCNNKVQKLRIVKFNLPSVQGINYCDIGEWCMQTMQLELIVTCKIASDFSKHKNITKFAIFTVFNDNLPYKQVLAVITSELSC